jgi:hypothetical protein
MMSIAKSKIAFLGIVVAHLFASRCSTASAAEILVYDENSIHHYAATAAAGIDPTPTIANSTTFNSLLTSQPWSAVFIDCPGVVPSTGWLPTINFIQSGGKVAMSFWDWDNDDGKGNPALLPAFGVNGTSSFALPGRTLTDAGTTSVFNGVTMPNSDWFDNWGDDGDAFGFTGASGTVPMAYLSGFSNPVMVLGNGGRTIATFVIDEAGPVWLGNGSAVRLWGNMYNSLVPEPSSFCLLVASALILLTRPRPLARATR